MQTILVTDYIRKQLEMDMVTSDPKATKELENGKVRQSYSEVAEIFLTEEDENNNKLTSINYEIEWIGFDDNEDSGNWIYPENVFANLSQPNVLVNNRNFEMDVVVNMMDDDTREEVHTRAVSSPHNVELSNQQFVDLYCIYHYLNFGEEFSIN